MTAKHRHVVYGAFGFMLLLCSFFLTFQALLFFEKAYSTFRDQTKLTEPNYHVIYNLYAIFIMIVGLSFFRLSRGISTLGIGFLHGATMIGAAYYINKSLKELPITKWIYLHEYPANIVYYLYFCQIVMALVVYVFTNVQIVRTLFVRVHSILGLWLYQCFIGVTISSWHNCSDEQGSFGYNEETSASGVEFDGCLALLDHFKTLLIFAAIFMNIFLTMPTLKWNIVGKL